MNKFHELDKQISAEIMPEFEGQVIESICPDCRGEGCDYCDSGTTLMEY